jgi:glycosyltransferase involved in cell wall biosynthesis
MRSTKCDQIVVVPCYNEARRFDPSAFRQFARRTGVRFILVNDGSTDETAAVLSELEKDAPGSFVALSLPRNVGKAEAVRQGFLTAFRLDPQFVAFWDADLATPLEAVCLFREVLVRNPQLLAVVGTRMRLLGHRVVRDPFRRCLSRGFAAAASRMLGASIRDTQCGAKMFRVSPEVWSIFRAPFRTKWIFDVELFARLMRLRGRPDPALLGSMVYEFPLEAWREMRGSKIGTRGFVRAAREFLVFLRDYRIRDTWRPDLDAGLPKTGGLTESSEEGMHCNADFVRLR